MTETKRHLQFFIHVATDVYMQLQFFCASVFFTEVWIKRVIIYGSSLILADLLFSLFLQEENMHKQSRMKLNLIDLVITVPNAVFSSTFLFDYFLKIILGKFDPFYTNAIVVDTLILLFLLLLIVSRMILTFGCTRKRAD